MGAAFKFIMGLFSTKTTLIYWFIGLILSTLIGAGVLQYNSMKNTIVQSAKEIKKQKALAIKASEQIDTLKSINEQNIQNTQKLESDYNKTIVSLEAKYKKEKEQVKVIVKIKERIRYVAKYDNGSVAPVLRDTLSWLRAAQATENNSTKNSD